MSEPELGDLVVERAELVVVELPLRVPWVTAHGAMTVRPLVLVHVRTSVGEGWGECAALPDAGYDNETTAVAFETLSQRIVPAVLADGPIAPEKLVLGLSRRLPGGIVGAHMAVAALEEAVLDAALRAEGRSLASWLGASRSVVPAGAVVGLTEPVSAVLAIVDGLVADGYQRVKLKISARAGLETLMAVRHAHRDLILVADANGSYAGHERHVPDELDALGLACIEQPLGADDLDGHAALARRLETLVCLDESITSLAAVEWAVQAGACEVVNLKAARVGGLVAARGIHDWCAARGVGLWIGGMLESAVGRGANVSLAAMTGCTIPGDISPSGRVFSDNIADDLVVRDGMVDVSGGPGVTRWPDPTTLARLTVQRREVFAA